MHRAHAWSRHASGVGDMTGTTAGSNTVEYLWVGFGGLLGANARYAVGRLTTERFGSAYPLGTLVVNLSGAFAIGVLMTVLTARVADPAWRLLLVTGFLGGYTTFSAYSLEVVSLLHAGRWGAATGYAVASNAAGLVACWGGIVVARALLP